MVFKIRKSAHPERLVKRNISIRLKHYHLMLYVWAVDCPIIQLSRTIAIIENNNRDQSRQLSIKSQIQNSTSTCSTIYCFTGIQKTTIAKISDYIDRKYHRSNGRFQDYSLIRTICW